MLLAGCKSTWPLRTAMRRALPKVDAIAEKFSAFCLTVQNTCMLLNRTKLP